MWLFESAVHGDFMYKPNSLFRLIQEINKSLFLPHIQRPFVWTQEQMERLFDSLMRNYPVQTLLFWRTAEEIKARRFMSEIDWEADLHTYYDSVISQKGKTKIFVLDGQQRLQSLYALFAGGLQNGNGHSPVRAQFDITAGAEPNDSGLLYPLTWSDNILGLPMYQLTDLLGKHEKRNPGDLAEQLNDNLDNLLQEADLERKARQKRVRSNIYQVASLLREDKHFWVEELDGTADEYSYKKVLDIFVRVNSGGTKLEAADLMFAVMKEAWDEIEERVECVVDMLRSGTGLSFDKDFALKCLVVSHGRGAELNPDKFNSSDGEKLLEEISQDWDRSEQAFQELTDFISSYLHLFSDKVIRTYGSFIPLFDFLYHNPKPSETQRALMRGYHYKAQLFAWFRAQTDNIINALHTRVGKQLSGFPLDEIKLYFGDRRSKTEFSTEELSEVRLRFIILNLVYTERFGKSPFNVKFKGNEPQIDHIYPRSELTKLSLPNSVINVIGNYRFVGANDNLRKRAESPASYFGRLKAGGIDISQHLLVQAYANHPSELGMSVGGYNSFLTQRTKEIESICSRVINPELAHATAVP